MNRRYFAVIGAVLAALGVLLGAYHAHGLEEWLSARGGDVARVQHLMDNAQVAIRYQMYHALALLILGSLPMAKPGRLMAVGLWLICGGLLFFSGGLYLIVFAGNALHWAIVPLGGLTLVAAWIVVAIAIHKKTRVELDQGSEVDAGVT